MRKIMLRSMVILLSFSMLAGCTAQQIQDTVGSILGNGAGGITSAEGAAGMKEALLMGIIEGTGLLSKKDGYYGNSLVKIPWPEEADFVLKAMSAIGMQDKVDNVTKSLNRAAEKAAGEAVDVFKGTMQQMTVTDALGIIGGGNGAGTAYFKSATSNELTNRFRPIIDNSMAAVNATRIWSDVINVYNKIPFTNKKVETDLVAFVTAKAMDGVFFMVEKKENEIREKVGARTSGILQKVFGWADQQKNNNSNGNTNSSGGGTFGF